MDTTKHCTEPFRNVNLYHCEGRNSLHLKENKRICLKIPELIEFLLFDRSPVEINYSTIAKGVKVPQHTVVKHNEMIQKMLGMKETAPLVSLDCQAVPFMV